jgi:hypothetical protein
MRCVYAGCLVAGVVTGALAIVVLVIVVAVFVIGKVFFSASDDGNAVALQKIVIETGIDTSSTDIVHPPQRDIHLGSCDVYGDGVRAAGTITNWTNEDANYSFVISFRSGGAGPFGAEFDSTDVVLTDIEPSATVNWDSVAQGRPDGQFTCRVMRIDRVDSAGNTSTK